MADWADEKADALWRRACTQLFEEAKADTAAALRETHREAHEAGRREGIATAIQYHKGQVENERRRRETARDLCDHAAETVADHHIIAHFNSATALRALAQEDQDV